MCTKNHPTFCSQMSAWCSSRFAENWRTKEVDWRSPCPPYHNSVCYCVDYHCSSPPLPLLPPRRSLLALLAAVAEGYDLGQGCGYESWALDCEIDHEQTPKQYDDGGDVVVAVVVALVGSVQQAST